MANTDAPKGLVPVRNVDGTAVTVNNYASRGYSIASGYATDIYLGDPVTHAGTADDEGRPRIQLATATGAAIVGVFAGCEYVDSNGEFQYRPKWAASTVATEIVANVYDREDTVFKIQADEDVVAADFGQTADFVYATGDDSTAVSAVELDSSNIGSGANLYLLEAADEQELGSNNVDVHVLINEHIMRGTATGGFIATS